MGLAADPEKYALRLGQPDIKSVGPMAFGPDGILFVADNATATVFAIDTRDFGTPNEDHAINVENLNARLMAYLGCWREDVSIRDMAVHPTSQNVYFSVMRQALADSIPLVMKLEQNGAVSEVPLENVPFSQTTIPNPPRDQDQPVDTRRRAVAVTDLAYVDGILLVAGSSNEEFSSTLRRIPFPFGPDVQSNSLEIFHVSHGRFETAAPIRTFVPYGSNTSVLASYTCTPVVHFSLKDTQSGAQVRGRTVAELGAGNTPIDLVAYQRDGEEYLLVSNQRHPLIRIACRDIDRQEGLTQANEPRGVPREALPHQRVTRMANLNGSYVLMMQEDDAADVHLRSYSTASL